MSIPATTHEICLEPKVFVCPKHIFSALPVEIFLKIIEQISIKDIQQLALSDKWLFTTLVHSDLLFGAKEIIFPCSIHVSALKIIDLRTRRYFGLKATPTHMLTMIEAQSLTIRCQERISRLDVNNFSEKECIGLMKSESPLLIEHFIHSPRFKTLRTEVLSEMLKWAAIQGHLDTVKMIVRSARFFEIDRSCLCELFSFGSSTHQEEIIKIIMLSPRFSDITVDAMILALLNASISGEVDIVFHIISSTRFSELPIDMLGNALEIACRRKQYEVVELISSCRYAYKIPRSKIQAAIIEASRSEDERIAAALTMHFRHYEDALVCNLC